MDDCGPPEEVCRECCEVSLHITGVQRRHASAAVRDRQDLVRLTVGS